MIWFLQMNLLNIDRTFSCQREYIDHTLLLYLQLCCQMIVLSDSPRCSGPFCSTYQSRARSYLITLLPVCKHPTRKLVSSLPVRAPVCHAGTGGRTQTGLPQISTFQFQVSSRVRLYNIISYASLAALSAAPGLPSFLLTLDRSCFILSILELSVSML